MRPFVSVLILAGMLTLAGQPASADRTVWISAAAGHLRLRLNTQGRCVIDALEVHGRQVLAPDGAWSGVKAWGLWSDSRRLDSPVITNKGDAVTVSGIRYGWPGPSVEETWTFTPEADSIRWRIERTYSRCAFLDDASLPAFHFGSMSTWTAALLDTGGVAWPKLLDRPNASYASHAGAVTFYNAETSDALRIAARSIAGQTAIRFTREPGGAFSSTFTVSPEILRPRHDQRRFLRNRQDVWAPFRVESRPVSVELMLTPLRYDQVSKIGDLKGIDAGAVREITNTIGRIGVIDRGLMGSNGWYSGCFCLHEPWFAMMGLPMQNPDYFRNLADSFDNYRDHIVQPDGRVKSRWSYDAGDSMLGTYDRNGFYEAKWGILLDSQPGYVSNVAELFEISGDVRWVRGQQDACRRALDFALARDSDGDGLIEVMTDSHAAARGSDWIDVIWAAFENGLVNAEMYDALRAWARVEEVLGDAVAADRYRAAAGRIKEAFNRPINEGGLWDSERSCYAYWRDADGSVHGRNFVVPVNFLAISTGLCDDPARVALILDRLEERMQAEGLFFWPLCLDSYQREEVYQPVNWPFPRYENGDMFLAWGQVGVRAYALYQPEIALKYVRNVLARYRQDGLAFQRFSRREQRGQGADILANNMLTVSGLYHDLYGIVPRHDGLLLDPRLPAELDGTTLTYTLRGQPYHLELGNNQVRVLGGPWEVTAEPPIQVGVFDNGLAFKESVNGSRDDGVEVFIMVSPEVGIGKARVEVKSLRSRLVWTMAVEFEETEPRSGKVNIHISGLGASKAVRLLDDAKGMNAEPEKGLVVFEFDAGFFDRPRTFTIEY